MKYKQMKHIKILILTTFVFVSVLNANADNNENEIILSECDFETQESFQEWNTYDLDGKPLSFFFPGQTKAWFWKYENDEEEDGNSVYAASSDFASNTMDNITPADDWLFSAPLALSEQGSYEAEWDARSLQGLLWPDDYDIRIIETDVLTELEESFTEQMLLSEVSAMLIAHSDLLLEVRGEPEEWQNHQLSLNAYKGKTICVIWRYISANNHTIYIDNFKCIKRLDTGVNQVYPSALEIPVAVYNLHGQLLLTSTVRSENECFDIALPSGIYLVKLGGKTLKLIR
jgi:hypothetical protein